jgi:hypothetical protein
LPAKFFNFSAQKFTIGGFPVEEEAPDQTESRRRNNVVHTVGQEIVWKPGNDKNLHSEQDSGKLGQRYLTRYNGS